MRHRMGAHTNRFRTAPKEQFLECVANECFCSNGTPATGSACTAHTSITCTGCDARFRLVDGTCKANTCRCPDGVPVPIGSCTTHNAVQCQRCNGNSELRDNRCGSKLCSCDNGEPNTGSACPADGPYAIAGKGGSGGVVEVDAPKMDIVVTGVDRGHQY